MSQCVAVVCTLVILGVFVVKCNARHGMDHGQFSKEKSISCYECNSAYDPRCGDPFDPFTIGIVNCSKKRPLDHLDLKPTLCRKTVQKVQGHLRVIRGCGYVQDKRDDKQCMVRTGTHDVNVKYCSCKHNLCNTGNIYTIPSRLIFSIILATRSLIHLV